MQARSFPDAFPAETREEGMLVAVVGACQSSSRPWYGKASQVERQPPAAGLVFEETIYKMPSEMVFCRTFSSFTSRYSTNPSFKQSSKFRTPMFSSDVCFSVSRGTQFSTIMYGRQTRPPSEEM